MNEQIPPTFKTKVISHALENKSFKQQLLSGSVAAKAAIESEIGQKLPESLEIRVLEEKSHVLYLVLPKIPSENREPASQKMNWILWLEEISFLSCLIH